MTDLKSLVIVESPAKAKTIKKYLGKNFEVKASVGHIIDLPPSTVGVDLESGKFEAEYVPIRGKGNIIKDLKSAAKKADRVYLAPDPDREGEAIAYHLQDLLKGPKKSPKEIFRVRFHEITKKAILKSFETPDKVDENLYNAQQARRILDRIVGYQISPVLWTKVRRGLSAGRVQSVAVRVISEREAEIKAFDSEEYWNIEAQTDAGKKPIFISKLARVDNKKIDLTNTKDAHAAKKTIEQANSEISKVTKKERKRKSGPPFTTSKLQQDAARAFRYSPKRTMRLAQGLYEGKDIGKEGTVGLITYMRTDSTNVSQAALEEVRGYIGGNFGNEFLPEKPNFFKTKKSAQEAHEAIRPTDVNNSPARVKPFLDADEFKLYKLIWDRFVASQMTPAVYDQTQIEITAEAYLLRASGSILKFSGFLKVYHEQIDEDDKSAKEEAQEEKTELPDVEEGQSVKFLKVDASQHFTQPPPRFNDASLVKELEDKGIGRPSTYASILSVIQDKGYVEKQENRLHPTELGQIVNELLCENFKEILDIGFTSAMEEKLDSIGEGKIDWIKVMNDFYEPFKKELADAKENMRNIKRMEEPTDIECPKCKEHTMVIKWGKNGSFLGCSGYPDCKTTLPFRRENGEIVIEEPPKTDVKCLLCGSDMAVKRGKYGNFLGCSKYPDCKGTQAITLGIPCPKEACSGEVTEKRSKRGKLFYGCNKYPNCDFVSWNKPVMQPCETCGSKYMEEKMTKNGAVLICPECKLKK